MPIILSHQRIQLKSVFQCLIDLEEITFSDIDGDFSSLAKMTSDSSLKQARLLEELVLTLIEALDWVFNEGAEILSWILLGGISVQGHISKG